MVYRELHCTLNHIEYLCRHGRLSIAVAIDAVGRTRSTYKSVVLSALRRLSRVWWNDELAGGKVVPFAKDLLEEEGALRRRLRRNHLGGKRNT